MTRYLCVSRQRGILCQEPDVESAAVFHSAAVCHCSAAAHHGAWAWGMMGRARARLGSATPSRRRFIPVDTRVLEYRVLKYAAGYSSTGRSTGRVPYSIDKRTALR